MENPFLLTWISDNSEESLVRRICGIIQESPALNLESLRITNKYIYINVYLYTQSSHATGGMLWASCNATNDL